MKLSPAEQDAVIALLTRIYTDIRDIELEFGLLAGENDYRPRIEYFHDAVRAFSAQDPKKPKSDPRLSIELLAYDVSCLRYLQSMPLAPFKPHGEALSTGMSMVALGPGLVAKPKRPDRILRERISELYQHYGALFAALLKPLADRDYKDRSEALNQDVQDIHALRQQMQGLQSGKSDVNHLLATTQHLEDEALREALMDFIKQHKYKKKEHLAKMVQFLKTHAAALDRSLAAIDAAHMNYALSQLAIFEDSKDMLKKMAESGMNLVGRFVEAATAQAKREMGR
jgi:hypothetical protein